MRSPHTVCVCTYVYIRPLTLNIISILTFFQALHVTTGESNPDLVNGSFFLDTFFLTVTRLKSGEIREFKLNHDTFSVFYEAYHVDKI